MVKDDSARSMNLAEPQSLPPTLMTSPAECVQQLLASFPARPFDQKILDDKVAQEVRKFQDASSQENVRSQWELVLRKEVFALAVRLARLIPSLVWTFLCCRRRREMR